jgi:putative ABC transport system permease protein
MGSSLRESGAGTLPTSELLHIAIDSMRARPLRAGLSTLGIAVGIAAVVSVLGLSASSQAALLAQIDRLGTNLLTVNTGHTLFGERSELPLAAPAMISRIDEVLGIAAVGALTDHAYRSQYIPKIETNGLAVAAAEPGVLTAVSGQLKVGRFLNAATTNEPVAALGAAAARRLGIDRVFPKERILIGSYWFYVTGILETLPLAPELDAAVFIGFPVAESLYGLNGHATTIYVRVAVDQVERVHRLLAATANPEHPDQVDISRPSDVLVARAKAQSVFNDLFLGLGLVVLLVGGLGVANIMVIAVLERRSEIGLRRALGATGWDIFMQFLSEAMVLAGAGGIAGIAFGATATALYSTVHGWQTVIPLTALAESMGAALLIGGAAGLLPAIRAARLAPTDALRSL